MFALSFWVQKSATTRLAWLGVITSVGELGALPGGAQAITRSTARTDVHRMGQWYAQNCVADSVLTTVAGN
jgi:hypothetical protein